MRRRPTTLAVVGLALLSLTMGAGPASARIGPIGRIAFTSWRDGNLEVYVMNEDGSGQTNLTQDPAQDNGPDWSPGGTKIAFSSDRNGQRDLYAMDRAGATGRLTATATVDEFSPAYGPRGSGIAFGAEGPASSGIGIAVPAGGERLVAEVGNNPPDWSPDGRTIAFGSGFESPVFTVWLYTMNPDGTGLTLLDSPDAWDVDPAWSPNGRWIAFSSDQDPTDGDFEIYAIRPDGTGLRQITHNFTDEFGPTWSPDGTKLAYASYRPNGEVTNYDIFVIGIDGAGEVRLTDSLSDDLSPDWRPTT